MQHLLDFIYEHSLDEQLYVVALAADAELELRWRRAIESDHWEVRCKCPEETPWARVHRDELLNFLRARSVHMESFEHELRAIAVTQIVFADMVLRDARRTLGSDIVRKAVLSHRDFVGELRGVLEGLAERAAPPRRPSVSIIKGGGQSTKARRGHLSLVPAAF